MNSPLCRGYERGIYWQEQLHFVYRLDESSLYVGKVSSSRKKKNTGEGNKIIAILKRKTCCDLQ